MTVLGDIDERSREIFRRLVETYLATGEPVGSRTLSHSSKIAVSAATVRNVMADLTDMGLLHSPHISAGRLPTELGLRLFVDGLMQVGDLTEDERRAIETETRADSADTLLEMAAARRSDANRQPYCGAEIRRALATDRVCPHRPRQGAGRHGV